MRPAVDCVIQRSSRTRVCQAHMNQTGVWIGNARRCEAAPDELAVCRRCVAIRQLAEAVSDYDGRAAGGSQCMWPQTPPKKTKVLTNAPTVSGRALPSRYGIRCGTAHAPEPPITSGALGCHTSAIGLVEEQDLQTHTARLMALPREDRRTADRRSVRPSTHCPPEDAGASRARGPRCGGVRGWWDVRWPRMRRCKPLVA